MSIVTRPYVCPYAWFPLRAIAAGCPADGLVVDPFCGAGTTGLAVLLRGRRFVGIDISAAFLDETLTQLTSHLPDLRQAAR